MSNEEKVSIVSRSFEEDKGDVEPPYHGKILKLEVAL